MKTLILLLTTAIQVFCTPENGSRHVSCSWLTEFLCGDKCVPFKGGKCFCGNRAFTLTHTYDISSSSRYCCNTKPCSKYPEDFAVGDSANTLQRDSAFGYIEALASDDQFSRHRRFS